MLSNTLRLDFSYLKIIDILRPRYHSKIRGNILKNKQKHTCVCFDEIIRLIIIKKKLNIKKRSHKYEQVDQGRGMNTNIVNIKRASV